MKAAANARLQLAAAVMKQKKKKKLSVEAAS
jgi:hypothetical protein